MDRRPNRWRARRSPAASPRRRRASGAIRKRDWLKLLLLLGIILLLGLGEPLKQIDAFFSLIGYH